MKPSKEEPLTFGGAWAWFKHAAFAWFELIFWQRSRAGSGLLQFGSCSFRCELLKGKERETSHFQTVPYLLPSTCWSTFRRAVATELCFISKQYPADGWRPGFPCKSVCVCVRLFSGPVDLHATRYHFGSRPFMSHLSCT